MGHPVYNNVVGVKAHDGVGAGVLVLPLLIPQRLCFCLLRSSQKTRHCSESRSAGLLAAPAIYSVSTATMILLFKLPLCYRGRRAAHTSARRSTARHRMTRAHPHDVPAPHTSSHCGASSTTSPPAAWPPSPWRSHDSFWPTAGRRRGAAAHRLSPRSARPAPAESASATNP